MMGPQPSDFAANDEVERRSLALNAMNRDRRSFWIEVYGPFMARDLTRDDVRAIVRIGLILALGDYHAMLASFGLTLADSDRFMGFLQEYELNTANPTLH